MDNKNRWYLAIGTGLGLAAGYYANSKKGKEMQAKAKEVIENQASNAKDMFDQHATTLGDKASETLNTINELLQSASTKGKKIITKIEPSASDAGSDVHSYVDQEIASLKKRVSAKLNGATA